MKTVVNITVPIMGGKIRTVTYVHLSYLRNVQWRMLTTFGQKHKEVMIASITFV